MELGVGRRLATRGCDDAAGVGYPRAYHDDRYKHGLGHIESIPGWKQGAYGA